MHGPPWMLKFCKAAIAVYGLLDQEVSFVAQSGLYESPPVPWPVEN